MIFRCTVLLLLFALCAPARGQNPPQPTLTQVTITSPVGTPQAPFRTNRELISIEFTTDAANGIFFATSRGTDVDMTTFLANTNTGKVGGGLLAEGIKNVTVLVSTGANVPTTAQIQITSKPITVILDRTPPNLIINQIKLRPNGIFEGFDPKRQYRTNADVIVLRGVVNDGANGVSPDQITISTSGTIQSSTATPDASGQWELTVNIGQEGEGSIDLHVVANDNVGGSARVGNQVEVPVGLR